MHTIVVSLGQQQDVPSLQGASKALNNGSDLLMENFYSVHLARCACAAASVDSMRGAASLFR